MSAESFSQATSDQEAKSYKWFVLFALFLVYTFNFLDRQLLSTLQEPIKQELGLTDSQLGIMTGFLFAVFYTSFGVVVGYFADRTNRKNILFIGCTLWSLFTIASGFAKNFPQMAMARVGVGIGEAAGAPPSYSIISDYFPAKKRGIALALFSLGAPAGIALGAGFGAKIHELLGWREAFIYIGLAGVLAGVFMFLVVKEPKKGRLDTPAKEIKASDQAPSLAAFKGFFRNPILTTFAVGAGLAALMGYAIMGWGASFLIRVQGMSMSDLAIYYAMALAISLGAGMLVSGFLVDFMVKRSRIWYGLVPMIAMITSIPSLYFFCVASSWQVSLIWMGLACFCNAFYLAPTLAVVQNYSPPERRTMFGALQLMILNLIGLGCGPTIVGLLSDYFAVTHGEVEGLRKALLYVMPASVLAAFCYFKGASLLKEAKK